MGSFVNDFRHLCTPAFVYLAISLLIWVLIVAQNLGNTSKYCIGSFSCNVPHTGAVFALKLVYILFWAWVLNLMCKDGHKMLSWFLVLLPFLLFFVLIGMIMVNQ